jgi:hypothetical protein
MNQGDVEVEFVVIANEIEKVVKVRYPHTLSGVVKVPVILSGEKVLRIKSKPKNLRIEFVAREEPAYFLRR